MILPYKIGTPLLVTTLGNGVFFGRLARKKAEVDRQGNLLVWLYGVCQAHEWGTTTGRMELATRGPNEKSKITKSRSSALGCLTQVTSITECTELAAARWDESSWPNG